MAANGAFIWEKFSQNMVRCCQSSMVSVRVPFLEELLQLVNSGELETPQLSQISLALLNTFTRYQDSKSKSLVVKILSSVVTLDNRFLSSYIDFILAQVEKSPGSKALVDYLNLLEWHDAFLQIIAQDDEVFREHVGRLVKAHTFATYGAESVLDTRETTKKTHSERNQHRRRVRHSILQSTSKALVSSFALNNAEERFSLILDILLGDSKNSLPVSGVILLMGALTQASLQLLPSRPAIHNLLKEKYADEYCSFIGKEVVLGKDPPSVFSLEVCLKPFLHEFVDEGKLNSQILPSLEKAILRAPSFGLNFSAELYSGLDAQQIDLLHFFVSSKLMPQCFSSLKSAKEEVKNESLSSMLTLLSNVTEAQTQEDDLLRLVDEIFKNIKSNMNAEYKTMASDILFAIPTYSRKISLKILTLLATYISKEANEISLSHMLCAFFLHYFSLKESDPALNKIITAGLAEKKLNLRKVWFSSFMRNCHMASQSVMNEFSDVLLEFLTDTLAHCQRYDLVSKWACFEFLDRLLASDMEEAALKALTALKKLPDSGSLGRCLLDVALSRSLRAADRLRCGDILQRTYRREPALIGQSIVEALESRIQGKDTESQDPISYGYITTVLNAISQEIPDKNTQVRILLKLLPLSQWKILNLKNNWAGLVANAKLDPAKLVEENKHDIARTFHDVLGNADLAQSVYGQCVVQAFAYTSFVNPAVIAPLISDCIQSDLRPDELSKHSEDDFLIWAGKEGEMVFDVLNKNFQQNISKNSKEYETLKWEASIRKKQVAKLSKKLTKEEQTLVNEQLNKESTIRRELSKISLRLTRSIKLIKQLLKDAELVDNGSEIWYPIAVSKLLALAIEPKANKLINNSAQDAFLDLASLISERLGSMRLFVGIAILRANQVPNLEERFLEEPLFELLSRVLFRVKFVSGQNPLDSLTLIYLLPLLINVLEEGKRVAIKNADKPVSRTEFVEEDEQEEHLLLAMEILSVHADAFEDSSIPRKPILQVLLSLLNLPSKSKSAKDCLNALCQSISVSPTEEDVQVLLSSLLSPSDFVRSTILQVIDNEFELEPILECSPEIFICKFDSDDSNRTVADFIWDFSNFSVSKGLLNTLLTFFGQADSGLRLFIAKAYATSSEWLMTSGEISFDDSLMSLIRFYLEKAQPLKPILDEYGLVVVSAAGRKDPWAERSTAAIALHNLVRLARDGESVIKIVKFLVQEGALGDREPLVRQEMKEAGVEIITEHGSRYVESLIPIFERSLSAETESTIKENVIILYGSLARHLSPTDERIHTIISRLLVTLDTPSSDVQQAVSACLSPLVVSFESRAEAYLHDLMDKLLNPAVPVVCRKGAAWGIAGLVKGYGISALSQFDIIRDLIEAAEDKKEPKRRESVAFAFEYLSKSLGKYFEPYVIEILPNILKNLGDSVPEVRDATAGATRAIMAHTTSFGVKKLIPVAISNLDEISWRTKRGSVELLGNMAYLDPSQLSTSLSTIVPQMVGVLSDSHKEVRKAADESLKRFGEVIRNPEIQKLVPVLIKAIGDPTKHTDTALDSLIETQFVHYIDGPSLALIIHVIHRGMHDRSANTKRKACKIVGNMAILVDTKDLIPYLQQLIDEVEIAMVDPVPSTRATAARALGALVEKLGEEQFPDLIDRLLESLSDETRSGDRLGSAQALAEVISGLGLSKLEEMLPVILAGVSSYRSYVREGYMPLLLFLPICFGSQFAPYINQIIQPILAGLADADENIRDSALKAGKLIVKNYATKAIDLLLPELERGMFDENERIRLSSVQLSGELLFQVTGISSKNEFSEEDGEYHGEVSKKMVDVLGQERRNRILSALFVCRNDTSGIVRANTVDIWKALVPNTPRTVKEILPTLISTIVIHLASSSETLRKIAAQTLGDMVRRVGGNALAQILPTLTKSLEEKSSPDSRQGVCIALRELITSSSLELLSDFQPLIVGIIRDTLVDSSETVRQASAQCFDAYQEVAGNVAVDEVLRYMLHLLESLDDAECALLGLQEIMSTKSDIIFPILIPTLLSPPIDAFKASAMGSLAEVAGSALYKRLGTIINALVDALIDENAEEKAKDALATALGKVFLSVTEGEGLHPLLQQIMALLKSEIPEKRIVVLQQLPNFFSKTALDYDAYQIDFVSNAILSLDDSDMRIVQGNFEALSALLATAKGKSDLEKFIKPAKQALQMTGQSGKDLPAFAQPKGPSCVLPIFLHGLMYGSNDEREDSALGIADVVSKTPAANLKPYVSTITGPLIRVVGERFNSDIKAAILFALNILFAKIPQFLRPFIPQLQRTFIKSLSDPSNETLRLRAAKALGTLIEYQPRVDPLVVELVTAAKQATDMGVKTAMLKALLEVVGKAGSKLAEPSKLKIVDLVEEEILSSNDKLVTAYARLIGAVSEVLSTEEAQKILKQKVLESDLSDDFGKFGILTLNSFLRDVPHHLMDDGLLDQLIGYILSAISSPSPYFCENGLIAAGKLLLLEGETNSPFSNADNDRRMRLGEDAIGKLIRSLSVTMLQPTSSSLDARRLSLVVVRTLARHKFKESIEPFLDILGPSVFSCLRDNVIPIKLASEKAYLAIFRLVEESDMATFNSWFEKVSSGGDQLTNAAGAPVQLRSIGDYTKRVGKRLANVERDRIAEGGDAEAMFSDQFEDEREIWAVGGVELREDI
ncbi:hypothetical protein HG536_0D02540 [Torulaspora globosa]|uniref:eIF-2-alpha kinase activator GCN1 n=1 Tax=Torulaspora globosa TaxID=48254 RepID=A0A7G3ZGU6_9SACH|nr:uncharacterized protein HG536_0D02540 [Torulaspora globosa]QLL32732.1 hypothetical protein HG536_0D02540 [Torulaspora globosa]